MLKLQDNFQSKLADEPKKNHSMNNFELVYWVCLFKRTMHINQHFCKHALASWLSLSRTTLRRCLETYKTK